MTSEEFWEEDPQLFWAFWDAYERKKKEEAEEYNRRAFNQGQYFLLALRDSLQFGKNHKKIYPKEPLKLRGSKKVQLSQKDYEENRKFQLRQLEERFNSSKK